MHSTAASEGRHAAMDDSGTVVVAATNARLASVAAGLSLVNESAAAHGRSACSMVQCVSLAMPPPEGASCPPRVDITANCSQISGKGLNTAVYIPARALEFAR